jgi:hypothetical protein
VHRSDHLASQRQDRGDLPARELGRGAEEADDVQHAGGDGQGRRSHDAKRKRDVIQFLEQLPGATERNRGLRRVGALLQSLHSLL